MFEKSSQINGAGDETYIGNLADSYRALGQTEKANVAYRRAIAIAKVGKGAESPATLGDIAVYYARIGDRKQALSYIRAARAKAPSDIQIMYWQAVVLAQLGKRSQSMIALKQAVAKGYPIREAATDPEFESLRSFPEFAKLVGPAQK
jgi:tetratricopeptide (TPR) repeat protein